MNAREIRIVFDGPPGAVPGRYVEVEDVDGKSISVGTWHKCKGFGRTGFWELRIPGVIQNEPEDDDNDT